MSQIKCASQDKKAQTDCMRQSILSSDQHHEELLPVLRRPPVLSPLPGACSELHPGSKVMSSQAETELEED